MAIFTRNQKLIILLGFLLTLMQDICAEIKAEKREYIGYDMEKPEGVPPERGPKRTNHRLLHLEEWDPIVFDEADLEDINGLNLADHSSDKEEDFGVDATGDDNEEKWRQKRSSRSLPRWFRMYCMKNVCRKRSNCNSFKYPKGRSYCRICMFSMCRGSGTNPLMASNH